MYSSNLYRDTNHYPAYCPSCERTRWRENDWETGLAYCVHCGWDKDNAALLGWQTKVDQGRG